MREVVHGDVVAVACALMAVPPEGWDARIAGYLLRSGGDVRPEPRLSDPVYAEAMVAVLMALIRRKQARQ